MAYARQMALDFLRHPGAVFNARRERCALPQYILNLCSLAGMIPLPEGVYGPPVGEPYGSLLSVWDVEDPNDLVTPLVAACDYHVAQSRSMTSKETPEFDILTSRLNPVEILALLRIRESLGLENPVSDHPILRTAAGRLYPPVQVEPDPIIEPALKCALKQIEVEKKKRGLP